MLTNLEKRYPHFVFLHGRTRKPNSSFYSCTKTNFLWTQLQHNFQNVLIIPAVTRQSAIFGFSDRKVNYHLISHILFIFKCCVYKTRENGSLDLKVFKKKHS